MRASASLVEAHTCARDGKKQRRRLQAGDRSCTHLPRRRRDGSSSCESLTDERPLNSDPDSEGEGAFRSVGALAGSELVFSYRRHPSGPWELRHRDELVGVVDRQSEMVRAEAGSWRVEVARRLFGWRLTFSPLEPGPIASYLPRHMLPGGSIALSDERSYRLRPRSLFARGWTVSDAQGTELVRVRRADEDRQRPGEWVVDLGSGVTDEPAAPLVLLATCYAVLVDQAQRPSSLG